MEIISILKAKEFYKLRRYRMLGGFVNDYKKYPLHPIRVFLIHRRGFTIGDWEVLGLSKSNYSQYLSSRDYNRNHPINGYYSKIIDDKLNIKYVLSETSLSCYMPDYYYIIDETGNIRPMMDLNNNYSIENPSISDLIELLKDKKKLALKLITGTIGKGFYKVEYKNEQIKINDKATTQKDFETFISTLKNYVVLEYLTTHQYLAQFWPNTANTLRYLVGSVNGEWRMIKSFIRFGSSKSGVVENFNAGGVLSYIDEAGNFQGGYIIGKRGKHSYTIPVERHPDTDFLLEGKIPCWDEIKKCAYGIERLLPQTKYLGLDFVITSNNSVKLLEINSLTSLDTIQLDCSILETKNGKWFFSSLLS